MAAAESDVLDSFRKDVSRASMRGKGVMTLEGVLSDSVELKYFKEYCIKEMSVENLLFWLEAQDYKSADAPEYRRFVAKKIFRKYIAVDAPMGISVTDAMRKRVAEGGEAVDAPRDLLNELERAVVTQMKLDIWPRFMESPQYNALVTLKFEERKVADLGDFDLYRFLGAGGFGMVLLGQKRDNKQFYAIKVFDKRILISQNQTHSIFREKEVLACVEHPFIVALRYGFQTEDHLFLVLDYIEGGNMYSDLMRGPYTHERACFYAAQIVLATQHLHELDILYRDLKPDNVLLTLEGNVKLADMGAARGLGTDGTIEAGEQATSSASKTAKGGSAGRRMTITGTHGYRAPEVYDRDYGKPADWWNVGILIIEMLTAENPLRGENRKESEHLTKHKDLTTALPSYIRPDAQSIALALLTKDYNRRLGCAPGQSVADIKAHAFFRPIDWDRLMAREMVVPFEPDVEWEPPARQPIPREFASQLDYFCQHVDYLKTSMAMRKDWPLSKEDQAHFKGFDYISNKVFEDDLNKAFQGYGPQF